MRCALDSQTAVRHISLLRVHICSALELFSLLRAITGKYYVILVKAAQWQTNINEYLYIHYLHTQIYVNFEKRIKTPFQFFRKTIQNSNYNIKLQISFDYF